MYVTINIFIITSTYCPFYGIIVAGIYITGGGKINQFYRLHVEKAKVLLSQRLDEELLLEEVASSLHVKPFTLLRNFKNEVGITPHAYRMSCRIEKARKLLQEGMDVSSAALECGFFDQSHFHRHFKAMTTTTPGEYQRNFIQ